MGEMQPSLLLRCNCGGWGGKRNSALNLATRTCATKLFCAWTNAPTDQVAEKPCRSHARQPISEGPAFPFFCALAKPRDRRPQLCCELPSDDCPTAVQESHRPEDS